MMDEDKRLGQGEAIFHLLKRDVIEKDPGASRLHLLKSAEDWSLTTELLLDYC